MREIRKANFFYPGFEHAGVESPIERTLTGTFCLLARIGAGVYDALSAPHPSQTRRLRDFEG